MSDRQQILNDQEFWLWLEFAASRWLKSSKEPALRRLWIDGFIPEGATNTKRGLDVEGVAWVGEGGRMQYEYRFVASLPQKLLHKPGRGCRIESLCLDEDQEFLQVVISSAEGTAEPSAAADADSADASPAPLG